MKIRVTKKDDGTFDVYLERTRPSEARNKFLPGVAKAQLGTVLRREAAAMRGESAPDPAEGP